MRRGTTLIELTIIIIVLFAFLSMSFIGVRVWKEGSDRAGCVINIRHMQQAVRGFQNTRNLLPGDDTTSLSPPLTLNNELVGTGKFLPTQPACPGNGVYTMTGNTIPAIGTLYMTCSLAASKGHEPSEYDTW